MQCVEQTDDTVTYRWTIADTGIGMSKTYLKQLFDPFTQEKNDARSVYQGTGLGMSIVKALLEQMHGSIAVTSEEGVGSTFVVTFRSILRRSRRAERPSRRMTRPSRDCTSCLRRITT